MSQYLFQSVWFFDEQRLVLKELRVVRTGSINIGHVVAFVNNDDEIEREQAEFNLQNYAQIYSHTLAEALKNRRLFPRIPLRGIERLNFGGEVLDRRLLDEVNAYIKGVKK